MVNSPTHKENSAGNDRNEITSNELKLMKLNRMVLHISFTLPSKEISAKPFISVLYNLFTPIAFIMYTLVLTAQFLGVYQYWGDLDVTMENLFLTTGFIMCYWEGAYMKIKRDQIWSVFDRFDSLPIPSTSNSTLRETHKKIVTETQASCKTLSWFIFLSVNVGTLMWAIFPLVNLLIHNLSEDESTVNKNASQEAENKPWPYLMYIIWVPYDATTMPMYAVTYLVQVLVYFAASLYNTSSNIIFLNLVLHATAKFKVVESSFLFLGEMMSESKVDEVGDDIEMISCSNENESLDVQEKDEDSPKRPKISESVLENCILEEDLQFNLDTEGSSDSSVLEDFLVECIKQHQDAIDFTRQLNFIVSPWIAFALLDHQLLLVAEVFQLALTAGSGFAILKHFMSILGVLSQSLLLCWLGDRVIQQSVRVKAAAYNCNWYNQSPRFKRLLHMVIKRAQDPVKFSAGHFYDINIEKFDHILRRAYSYYAVLREMKEPD